MYGEIGGVVIGEAVAKGCQAVDVGLTGLPGVELSTVDIEASIGAAAVGPVVIAVDFRVEGQPGQEKPGHGTCDAAVVVALAVAALPGQQRGRLLQLAHHEAKNL